MTREVYVRVDIDCDHPCVGYPPHECLHSTIWFPDDGVNTSPPRWRQDIEGWRREGGEDDEPADICDPCWAIMERDTPHDGSE